MSEKILVGKMVFHKYPEEYTVFVTELIKNHPELCRAMEMANCRIEDGTAFDYLNQVLDTKVTKDMPMTEGYSILYYALLRRTSNLKLNQVADRIRVDNEYDPFGKKKLTYDQLFLSSEELGKDGE